MIIDSYRYPLADLIDLTDPIDLIVTLTIPICAPAAKRVKYALLFDQKSQK